MCTVKGPPGGVPAAAPPGGAARGEQGVPVARPAVTPSAQPRRGREVAGGGERGAEDEHGPEEARAVSAAMRVGGDHAAVRPPGARPRARTARAAPRRNSAAPAPFHAQS